MAGAFRPRYRPQVGDWKNNVRRLSAGLVTSWAQAMAQAEDELQAEGQRFAMIPEVEQRAREILARHRPPDPPLASCLCTQCGAPMGADASRGPDPVCVECAQRVCGR